MSNVCAERVEEDPGWHLASYCCCGTVSNAIADDTSRMRSECIMHLMGNKFDDLSLSFSGRLRRHHVRQTANEALQQDIIGSKRLKEHLRNFLSVSLVQTTEFLLDNI